MSTSVRATGSEDKDRWTVPSLLSQARSSAEAAHPLLVSAPPGGWLGDRHHLKPQCHQTQLSCHTGPLRKQGPWPHMLQQGPGFCPCLRDGVTQRDSSAVHPTTAHQRPARPTLLLSQDIGDGPRHMDQQQPRDTI